MADLESLEFKRPTALYIDCLEDSEVVMFHRDSLLNTSRDHSVIAKNFQLLYRRIGMLQRRIIMQMSSPAIDRYH